MTHYAANETQKAALLGECGRCEGVGCAECRTTGKVPDWSLLLWVRGRRPFRWSGSDNELRPVCERGARDWGIHCDDKHRDTFDALQDKSDGLYVLLDEVCKTCGGKKKVSPAYGQGIAFNGAAAVECKHGYDACPECDAIDCPDCTDGHRYRLEALERVPVGAKPVAGFRDLIICPETREWWTP